MPEFDQRFLTIHPATALWFEQRAKCEACANCFTSVPACEKRAQHGGMRCSEVPSKSFDKSLQAYCIDARLEGAPCGPDAALFKPKENHEPQ